MKATVLDSYALIAYLERQEGYSTVARILEECIAKDRHALLCVVNWGEIIYHALRVGGEPKASLADDAMRALPIELVEADKDLTFEAARFKAKKKMSYADCFAAALAKQKNAVLATGDKDFEQVRNELRIIWL